MVGELVCTVLRHAVACAVRGGWGPADLAAVTTRRLAARHLPYLADLLACETRRHPDALVPEEWRADLRELGAVRPLELATAAGLEVALGLAALLRTLPAIPPIVPRRGNLGPPRAASVRLAQTRTATPRCSRRFVHCWPRRSPRNTRRRRRCCRPRLRS